MATLSSLIFKNSPNAQVRMRGGSGTGSTNVMVRRFTTAETNVGTGVAYAASSTLGDTFTINEAGVYFIRYQDYRTDAGLPVAISLNFVDTSTAAGAVPEANKLAYSSSPAANGMAQCSGSFRLAAGDVIRAHSNSGANGTDYQVQFLITQLTKL